MTRFVDISLQPHSPIHFDINIRPISRYGIHDFCKHLEFLDLNNITDWPAAANLFVFRDLPEISEFRGPYSSTLDPHIWAEPTTRSPRFIVPFDPSIINATSWRWLRFCTLLSPSSTRILWVCCFFTRLLRYQPLWSVPIGKSSYMNAQ